MAAVVSVPAPVLRAFLAVLCGAYLSGILRLNHLLGGGRAPGGGGSRHRHWHWPRPRLATVRGSAASSEASSEEAANGGSPIRHPRLLAQPPSSSISSSVASRVRSALGGGPDGTVPGYVAGDLIPLEAQGGYHQRSYHGHVMRDLAARVLSRHIVGSGGAHVLVVAEEAQGGFGDGGGGGDGDGDGDGDGTTPSARATTEVTELTVTPSAAESESRDSFSNQALPARASFKLGYLTVIRMARLLPVPLLPAQQLLPALTASEFM